MVSNATDALLAAAEYQHQMSAGWVYGPHQVDLDWLEGKNGGRRRVLRWRLLKEGTQSGTFRAVKPTLNLARPFAELALGTEKEILRFAKKYGILGVCAEHAKEELPCVHRDVCWPIAGIHPADSSRFIGGMGAGVEPLRYWRRYAWRVRALVEVGQSLAFGELPAARWVKILFPGSPAIWKHGQSTGVRRLLGSSKSKVSPRGEDLALARYWFAREAERLYSFCGVQPVLDWQLEKTPRVGRWIYRTRSVKPFNLVSIIAQDTCHLICETAARLICSGCGHEYDRKGRAKLPKYGQHNYCERCRKAGVSLRKADEKRRQKMRGFEALYREGRPLEEIVSDLDLKLSTAQSWGRRMEIKLRGGTHDEAKG